jgi:flagellar M-ring protein FliF
MLRRILTAAEPAPPVPAAASALPANALALARAGGLVTAASGPSIAISESEPVSIPASRTSTMIDIAQVQGQVHAQSVQKVGELAEKNPNETVAIIRGWLHENAA